MIVHDLLLPLAILGQLEEGDRFETNAGPDSQCDILMSQRIPFLRSILLMSLLLWVLARLQLLSSLLVPFTWSRLLTWLHPLYCTLSLFPSHFHPSLDAPKSTFVESETFVLHSPSLA